MLRLLILLVCVVTVELKAKPFESVGSLKIYRTINKVVVGEGQAQSFQLGQIVEYGLIVANDRNAPTVPPFNLTDKIPAGFEFAGGSSAKAWPRSKAGRLARAQAKQLSFEVGELGPGDSSTVFATLKYVGEPDLGNNEVSGAKAVIVPRVTPTPPPVPAGETLVAGLSQDKSKAILGLRFEAEGNYWVRVRNFSGEITTQKDLGFRAPGTAMEIIEVLQLAPGIYIVTLERNGTPRPIAKFKFVVTR